MEESPASFSDEVLFALVAESHATLWRTDAPTHEVFDRISKFHHLYRALVHRPSRPALLFRTADSLHVSCEEVAERLVIGRLSKTAPNLDGADVAFPHLAEMSRRHFEIVRASGFHLVRDLNSRNGTLVNDVAVGTEAEVLKAGDIIVAAGMTFAYTG